MELKLSSMICQLNFICMVGVKSLLLITSIWTSTTMLLKNYCFTRSTILHNLTTHYFNAVMIWERKDLVLNQVLQILKPLIVLKAEKFVRMQFSNHSPHHQWLLLGLWAVHAGIILLVYLLIVVGVHNIWTTTCFWCVKEATTSESTSISTTNASQRKWKEKWKW